MTGVGNAPLSRRLARSDKGELVPKGPPEAPFLRPIADVMTEYTSEPTPRLSYSSRRSLRSSSSPRWPSTCAPVSKSIAVLTPLAVGTVVT